MNQNPHWKQLIWNWASIIFGNALYSLAVALFLEPAGLITGGATGIALAIGRLTGLSVSGLLLFINLAMLVWGWVVLGRAFALNTMASSVLSPAFLALFEGMANGRVLTEDIFLCTVFAGLGIGVSLGIVIRSGASTGGTDFIALWVSNHTGKTIWGVIFGFNCFILAIFGFMFGWDKAAYSIVFQFISTKTIDSFYRRYDRVTLQITTHKADEVMTAYVDHFQHGISCAEVIGGYSREKMYLLHAVVSTYESQDIIKLVCDIDPGAVINVFHTLNFVGGWWGGHVDEPMPTAVPDPDKPARMASRQARLSEQDSLQQDDGR